MTPIPFTHKLILAAVAVQVSVLIPLAHLGVVG
jgi:hypothetical protein